MSVALHLVNPDAYIVRSNAQRLANGKRFDAWYNGGLSADAVPTLMQTLPTLNGEAHHNLSRSLFARLDNMKTGDWRSWSWSRQNAKSVLTRHEVSLRNEVLEPIQSAFRQE